MRKTAITAITVIGMAITGCGGGGAINVAPDVTGFINSVRADVEALCQVEPVLADLAALYPIYGAAAAAAANAICAAVKKPSANVAMVLAPSGSQNLVRIGVPPVVVHGHTIHFQ